MPPSASSATSRTVAGALCQVVTEAVDLIDKLLGRRGKRPLWFYYTGNPTTIIFTLLVGGHALLSAIYCKNVAEAAVALIIAIGPPFSVPIMWMFYCHLSKIRDVVFQLKDVCSQLEKPNTTSFKETVSIVRLVIRGLVISGCGLVLFFPITFFPTVTEIYPPLPPLTGIWYALFFLVVYNTSVMALMSMYCFEAFVMCTLIIVAALFRELGVKTNSACGVEQLKEVIVIHQDLVYIARQLFDLQAVPLSFQLISMIGISLFGTISLVKFNIGTESALVSLCGISIFVGLCLVCSMVDRESGALCENLYRSDWLESPLPNQKRILTMMTMSSRSIRMTVPVLGPITKLTITAGLKTWYSFLQTLLNL